MTQTKIEQIQATPSKAFLIFPLELALTMYTRRFEIGLELEIYSRQEYICILVWMRQLYSIGRVNKKYYWIPGFNPNFTPEMGSIMSAMLEKSDPVQLQAVVDYYILDAKLAYSRGLVRMLHFLLDANILKSYIVRERAELNYTNRFQCMAEHLYVKRYSFEECMNEVSELVGKPLSVELAKPECRAHQEHQG